MDDFLGLEQAIIERLKSSLPGVEAFGSLLEYSAIPHQSLVYPSVFVGFGGYSPSGEPLAGGGLQQVAQNWVVMVAVRSQMDRDGSILRQNAGPILGGVLRLLMGWRPVEWAQPLKLTESNDPEYGGGCGFFYLGFSSNVACRGAGV